MGLIALLFFYLWNSDKRKQKLIALVCSTLLIISVSSFQKDMNISRLGFKRFILGRGDSIFSEYRMSRITMARKILNDYPLWGIGFNHFRIRFNEYCDKRERSIPYEFKIPDNMYLTFLAETGIIGTSGFLVFILFLFKRGFKRFNELKDKNEKYLLRILFAAVIGFLVNMGAYELFYWNTPYMFFCLICGFIQGSLEKPDKITI